MYLIPLNFLRVKTEDFLETGALLSWLFSSVAVAATGKKRSSAARSFSSKMREKKCAFLDVLGGVQNQPFFIFY